MVLGIQLSESLPLLCAISTKVSLHYRESTPGIGRRLSRWPGRREELPTGALPPAPACLIPISLCTPGVHQEGRRHDHSVGGV